MERIIKIGGKDVKMKCSATNPFEYRYTFGGDIIAEMRRFEAEVEGSGVSFESMEMFSQLAWLMAKNAGEEVHKELPTKDAILAWLDEFDGALALYEAIPEIYSLWRENNASTSVPKKA